MFHNAVHVHALVNNSHNKTNKFVIYSKHFAAHLTLPSELAAPRTPYPTPSKAGHVVSKIHCLWCVRVVLPPVALRSNVGHGLLILKVTRSHTTTHHSR